MVNKHTDDLIDIAGEIISDEKIGISDIFSTYDAGDANTVEIREQREYPDFGTMKNQASYPLNDISYETTTVDIEKYACEVKNASTTQEIVNGINLLFTHIASDISDSLYGECGKTFVGTQYRQDIIPRAVDEANKNADLYGKETVLLSQVLAESIVNDLVERYDSVKEFLNHKYEPDIVIDDRNVLRGGDVIVADRDSIGYTVIGTLLSAQTFEDMSFQEILMFTTRRAHIVTDNDSAHISRFGNI